MHGEVRIVEDVPAAFRDAVGEAWRQRIGDGFTMAVSGGETARRCYESLASWSECPVDWMRTEVYWGDERCVPHDHPDSNYRLVSESLLRGVAGVNALFPMRCEEGEDDAYHLLVSSLGSIDLVHLGLGTDGHTASLFPGSPALDADPGRFVVRNEDPTGANPHPRMTFTFAGIAKARTAVVTVEGEHKREAFAAVCAGDDVPAARIQAPNVIWLVDPAAAGP